METALVALSNELAAAVEQAGRVVVAVHGRPRVSSSGVVWSAGVIVTADHTLRRDDGIRVTLADGSTVPAEIAGRDGGTDLAVLKAETGATPGLDARGATFLIPEDRRLQGLILSDSVKNNITLPSMDRVSAAGLIRPGAERALADKMTARLGVRTSGIDKPVGLLSGGNQQKVVLAKWLARRPRVLILDEPTRGIDVGAKSEIYSLMDRLAREGMAVLMISSDLEEVLNMSDRVLVMYQGRLAGELPRERLSEEAVMHLATGGGL